MHLVIAEMIAAEHIKEMQEQAARRGIGAIGQNGIRRLLGRGVQARRGADGHRPVPPRLVPPSTMRLARKALRNASLTRR
jgi:hypothetical protein